MSVTRRQFELGVTAECEQVMRVVYHFLADRPDYAFSLPEIKEGLIQEEATEQAADHLGRAMEVLVGLLAVDQRRLGQGQDAIDYFAILQEFDTGTWLSVKHQKRQAPPMPGRSDS